MAEEHMPTETMSTPDTEQATLAQLLEEQRTLAKRTRAFHTRITVLVLALVVVFGVGLFALNSTLSRVTQDVPKLVTEATQSLEQAQQTLTEIDKVDFGAMNEAIQGIAEGVDAINFETLNNSIKDLNTVVEALSKVVRFFG